MLNPQELAEATLVTPISVGELTEPECWEDNDRPLFIAAIDFLVRNKTMQAVELVKTWGDDHQYRAKFTLVAADGQECTFDEAFGHESHNETDPGYAYLVRNGSGKRHNATTLCRALREELGAEVK